MGALKCSPLRGVVSCWTGSRAAADRDRIRELAARRAVEHQMHGSAYMTEGWPDPEDVPASYAHIRGDSVEGALAMIRENPEAVAQAALEQGFVAAGTPDDIAPILERFAEADVDPVGQPLCLLPVRVVIG